MSKHTAQQIRGHLFRGSREKLKVVYIARGMVWGSVLWPVFVIVTFVCVDLYVEQRPLHR